MSLSIIGNQLLTNPTSTKTLFDYMANYENLVYTEDNLAVLADYDDCIENLTSRLYASIVREDRSSYLASLRVTRFKDHFNSFKNDPDHQCKCVLDPFSCCMHPGHFDMFEIALQCEKWEHCLICQCMFKDEGGDCEHDLLIEDCGMLFDRRHLHQENGQYAAHLARLLRKDATQKASEEHGLVLKPATSNKRKAAIVLERLDTKKEAWLASKTMTTSYFFGYLEAEAEALDANGGV